MSIILEGFVDGNLLITEGYGTGVPKFIPIILELEYELSDIIKAKPSTPFTTEQLQAIANNGIFFIHSINDIPNIDESITLKLSDIKAYYIPKSDISYANKVELYSLLNVFNIGKSVIMKIGDIKQGEVNFVSIEKRLPTFIFAKKIKSPDIVKIGED